MPKGIVLLVENLPVPFDRRMWLEATTLAEAGYRVSVICPRGAYRKYFEVLEGVRVYRYPLPSLDGVAGHLLEYSLALVQTFALSIVVFLRGGFDAVHSANPPDVFFLIGGVFKLLGKKYVFDHHDLVPEACETRWRGWKLTTLRRLCLWAEKATFRTADRVLSTNESYRAVALRRGGLSPEHVVVVRSAPSLAQFHPMVPSGHHRDGFRHLVCYLGVMGPNDGVDYLLRSIAHVVHDLARRDVLFTLIGDGCRRSQLQELGRELRIEPFVRFTGRIPDQEMIELLSSADLCVAPDPKEPLNDLSTMNKVVEYMALGKPIVAFDLRETRASAGEGAVYATPNDPIDFGDRIVELLSSPERRRALGGIGAERFRTRLAWEHQKAALLEVYRDLLEERPPEGRQV